LSLGNIFSAV